MPGLLDSYLEEGDVENWNDDRLDELSRRMDDGFREMREGFARLGRDMKEGFTRVDKEMKGGFGKVDREMKEGFLQASQRIDQTNQRIDKLMLVNLAGALGIIGTLIAIAAT